MAQEETSSLRHGIAVAVSGGGFRATLFHIGAFWRLNELGYLKKLDRITSVSGGSIFSARLACRWRELHFDANNIATNYVDEVVEPLRTFCDKRIDWTSFLMGAINPFKSVAETLAWQYDRNLYHGFNLADLPDDKQAEGPRFIFYATNLQTGVSVRLSRPYIADYLIGMLEEPDMSLAAAVAASSAFPPLFTPLVFKSDPHKWKRVKGADLFDNVQLRRKMLLSDGGVYDNMGLEAASRYETILISDAGAPFVRTKCSWPYQVSQVAKLKRVLDIAIEQSRAVRMRQFIDWIQCKRHKGTYWGIATNIDEYKVTSPMVAYSKAVGELAKLPTRLSRFDPEQQGKLINWGYALTDAAIRRYVMDTDPGPGTWPVPEYPL